MNKINILLSGISISYLVHIWQVFLMYGRDVYIYDSCLFWCSISLVSLLILIVRHNKKSDIGEEKR